jgi:hypothetical protein
MKHFVLPLSILCTVFLSVSMVGIVGAETYTFDTGVPPGMTLGGSMTWNGTGGGHLYCEQYYDDDLIFLTPAVFISSFQMNAMPWEGYGSGDIGLIDIAAFDSTGNKVWSTTVDLTGYTNWSDWLTVSVETDNISSMIFYSTYNTHENGFWPSIDNMVVNEADLGSINGRVTDLESNPIKSAFLIAINADNKNKYKAFSDTDGYYEIPELPAGMYWIICIKKGYKAGIKKAEVITGEVTNVSFMLTPKQE